MNRVSKISDAGIKAGLRSIGVLSLAAVFSAGAFAQGATPTPTPSAIATPEASPTPDVPPVAPTSVTTVRPMPAIDRIGVDDKDALPLSLTEAIALALKSNNDIDSSRINMQIAEYNLKAARSIFDPLFSSETYYENRTTPTSSTISGGANGSVKQTLFSNSSNLTGFSPFGGGSYTAQFANSRTVTNNQFATLNPQYPSSLSATYTQPLWRGLRFDANRYNIEIAKKNVNLTDYEFRRIATETVAQVEQGYWDLVYALRNLQVQNEAVRQSRLQLESNERMVKQGVLAPIEVEAAQVQVTTYEQNVYIAQEQITRAENVLKTLILPDRTAAMWGRALMPVTPAALQAPNNTLQDSITDALKNRPELAQVQTNREINQISTRYFRELTKPRVDLIGGYTTSGLAGANTGVSQTIPDNLIGGIGRSLSSLIGQDYPTYRIGVSIQLPIGNGVAKANLGSSLAEGRRIQVEENKAEQAVESEVRNGLQALRSAEARLNAAIASRESAQRLYESEQRQFRAGTTTVYLVTQRQNELVFAQGNEIQAQTALNKAISEYQRSTGTTLSVNNVAIETMK